MPIRDWSQTAASNATADSASGISWPEGQSPATVNDSARAMMAEMRKWKGDNDGTLVLTGAANTYAVTTNQSLTSYADGMTICASVNVTNTGAATLNVNGLGAKAVVSGRSAALANQALAAGQLVQFRYLSGVFQASEVATTGAGGDVLARVLPVGSVIDWSLPTIPAGWTWLIGTATGVGAGAQQLLKASYPELNTKYSADSYPYGSDSTNFTLPPVGARYARAAITLGTLGTLLTNQNKQHNHTATHSIAVSNAAGGAHSHTYTKSDLTGSGSAIGAATDYNLTQTTANTSTSATHTHTATVTGSVTIANDTGGTESRPDTIYVAKIMLTNPAAASAAATGLYGLSYAWSTGVTVADPGNGILRLNNATYASATTLVVSETDAFGVALASVIALWDDSTSAIKSRIKISPVGSPSTFILLSVTGTLTDAGTYDTFPVTVVASNGTIADGAAVSVSVFDVGDKGDQGIVGPGNDTGFHWLYATSTTMADPSAGNYRLNNATMASVTAAAVSGNNSESGNPSVYPWMSTYWGASSSTTKGSIAFRKAGNPQIYAIYDVTAVTNNTTWVQLTLTYRSAAGTFAASDSVTLEFIRNGDAGSGAVTSFNGRAGVVVPTTGDYTAAQVGALASFNGRTTSAAVPTAGDYTATQITTAPAGNIAAITVQAAITELDAEKQNVSALNAASGYAGLDASSKLTRSQQVAASTLQVFTASGTWTKPSGCQSVLVRSIGGGGGGGGASGTAAQAAAAGGGGAGGTALKNIDVTAIATVTVTIGAGGTAGANTGGTGGTGGTTSFGSHTSSAGGAGGVGMTTGTSAIAVSGGLGGVSTSGNANVDGSGGAAGIRLSGSAGVGGGGGSASLGGGGRSVGALQAGDAGVAGGGGGGGLSIGATSQLGGVGGAGIVVVEEFY